MVHAGQLAVDGFGVGFELLLVGLRVGFLLALGLAFAAGAGGGGGLFVGRQAGVGGVGGLSTWGSRGRCSSIERTRGAGPGRRVLADDFALILAKPVFERVGIAQQ